MISMVISPVGASRWCKSLLDHVTTTLALALFTHEATDETNRETTDDAQDAHDCKVLTHYPDLIMQKNKYCRVFLYMVDETKLSQSINTWDIAKKRGMILIGISIWPSAS